MYDYVMVNVSRSFKALILILGMGSLGLVRGQPSSVQSGSSQSSGSQSGTSQTSGSQSGGGTSSSTSPSSTDKSGTYVRRFSIGATLSVLPLDMIHGGSSTVDTSSSVTTDYSSSNASTRFGYGITAQAAITDHIAVAVGAYLRHMGYTLDTTVNTTTPVVEGGTVVNTITSTSTHEDTRSHVFDVPFVVRYYRKDRHTRGPRWFAELGGSWRDVTHIRSSYGATDASGNSTCCTFGAATPAHKSAIGYVAGAGLQFIDPVGIRVVPEVRYTRWRNEIFDANTVRTAANQLEVCFTLAY